MSSPNGASLAHTIRDAVQRALAGGGAEIAEAVLAVPADELGTFLHADFANGDGRTLLTTALGASPGAASGIIVLSADDALDAVLKEGSDVYASDVQRLVRAAQAEGQVADGDPAFYAVGVMGAVSSFSHAHRKGRLRMPIDELALLVGDWVTQALTGRASEPTTARSAPPG